MTLLAVACLMAACSSGSAPSTPTTPSPPVAQNPPVPPSPPMPPPGPSGPATVMVTASGFSPKDVTIPVGSHVIFTNTDTRPHDIWGGFDHNNRECPEIDVAGFLVPGQTRNTAAFTAAATCAFHDHTNIGVAAYQGRIIVQ